VNELADRAHGLRLPALEVADEVPAEFVAVPGMLGLEILGPVLADDVDPGLGQDPQLLFGDVLRRGDDGDGRSDLGLDALVALPDLLR
jgi:hypothetical protein